MGWAANPTRKIESLFSLPIIQMGARVYLPTAGRFLQVDPIEGGSPSAYIYPTDPINGDDYSGQLWSWLQKVVNTVKSTAKTAWNYVKSNPADTGSMLPVVGSPLDIYTFLRDSKKGDKVGASLSLIGFIPLYGDISKLGGKASKYASDVPNFNKIKNQASNARFYSGIDASSDIYSNLSKHHGVDRYTASARLHSIKESAGLRGSDNVTFGMTGDIYNSVTGDWIGTLTGPTF